MERLVWLHGFAEEFTTNFAKMFTKHYAEIHDSKLADELGRAILKAREDTEKEIASALLAHTKLTQSKIASCCNLNSATVEELSKANNNNTKEGRE